MAGPPAPAVAGAGQNLVELMEGPRQASRTVNSGPFLVLPVRQFGQGGSMPFLSCGRGAGRDPRLGRGHTGLRPEADPVGWRGHRWPSVPSPSMASEQRPPQARGVEAQVSLDVNGDRMPQSALPTPGPGLLGLIVPSRPGHTLGPRGQLASRKAGETVVWIQVGMTSDGHRQASV